MRKMRKFSSPSHKSSHITMMLFFVVVECIMRRVDMKIDMCIHMIMNRICARRNIRERHELLKWEEKKRKM